jgi:hypothetical protein
LLRKSPARESGGNAGLMESEENKKLFPSLPTALGNRHRTAISHIPTALLLLD